MKLEKIEQATKIALSMAVVGTACKIALERHHSHMAYRRKIGEILSAIGPHYVDSELHEFSKFCMSLLKES
ncbi:MULTISPECIES: hypothetical protein [Streptococcus]|uniref:hypothetical protein n=1 Tax=Streptococcus TaxID=1301 RepID=UPI000405FC9C|nr:MULTISPECIES: hypothetical protein [Streptococcus]QBX24015.1 hypothetical protein Javan172_0012 [Streptococcus phage Javan172]UNI71040.1 hypothetical protein [Streptococcus phage phiAp1.1-Spec]AKG28119.1 hypothetical protein SPAP1_05740 [Streptococcus pyogenes]ASO68516.1 hypothetical protein CFA72_05725 [Streptococcus pyogenes]ASO74231.1 hypothetical protein B2G65_05725 [Streptococcus pyogenes]